MSHFFTLFYFILALFLLVIVHESGHFLVARLCGVKVLRFSFGFGRVLAQFTDRRGTEFAWSLFPLGGYVKMLDEEEGPVAESERPFAFNRQSVWRRIAIVLAGPLFNLLFAFAAFWLVLVVGISSLAPMISGVMPGSIAAQAGLAPNQEIISLNHHPISSWHEFQYALMPLVGANQSVPMTVKSRITGQSSTHELDLTDWQLDIKNPDALKSLGMIPFEPTIPPIVGQVMLNSPAFSAGFKARDVVSSVEGVAVTDWLDLLVRVKARPDEQTSIIVSRQGVKKTLSVKLGHALVDGHVVGQLGVQSELVKWPTDWLRVQREGPIQAVGTAFHQTVNLTSATFSLIGRLATGRVSLRGISGPVGIAEGAGASARGGFSYYVSFLALISISLGVLNLLPIPMLDGGHLLFYAIECLRRRPLSARIKSTGMVIGLVFLVGLMGLALTNDLSHLANKY